MFWQSVENCGSAACYQAYLNQYPKGDFAALAKIRLNLTTTSPPPDGQSNNPPPQDPPQNNLPGSQMVLIEGSCYQMGSPANESGRDDDEQQHKVCVDDFYISKYEVTFAEYDAFAEATGRDKPDDEGWGRGNRPIINVSWQDANGYLE